MARPRSFDENAVLTNVMHQFRRSGYAATSVRDLEAASGLTSGSLYNTYGDKRGVFEAASQHYNQTVLERRIREHAPPGSGINGLRTLFLSLLDEPEDGSFGCLITNCAIEFGSATPPPFVAEGLDRLQAVFADRLDGSEIDALRLLAFYQGILVLFRSGTERAKLDAMISNFFDQLEKT